MNKSKLKKQKKVIEEYTFLDHLEELRWRIIKTIIGFVVVLIASLFFVPTILSIIRMPIININIDLNVFSFQGYFFAYLKVGLISALILSFPVAVYQTSAFVLPGLHSWEKKWYFVTLIFSVLFFISGVCFSYFVLTPISFNFLYSFATGSSGFNLLGDIGFSISVLPGLNEYIDLFLLLLLLSGLSFQLPLVIMFLTKIGIIDDRNLSKYRAHSFIIILVVSAFFTPPDVITQLILGVPLYLLFELSILLSSIIRKRRERTENTVGSHGENYT